jgi:hypothetical protein
MHTKGHPHPAINLRVGAHMIAAAIGALATITVHRYLQASLADYEQEDTCPGMHHHPYIGCPYATPNTPQPPASAPADHGHVAVDITDDQRLIIDASLPLRDQETIELAHRLIRTQHQQASHPQPPAAASI